MQRQLALEGSTVTPRSNLTPVPITDKNGVQTARWKRAQPQASAMATIPSVAPVSRYPQWDAIVANDTEVARLLVLIMDVQKVAKKRRENMLAELAPDTLTILSNRSEDDIRKTGHFIHQCVAGGSLISLNNAATFIDCKDEAVFCRNNSYHSVFFKCVAGLREYSTDADYSSMGADDRKGGRALLMAAERLQGKHRNVIALRGTEAKQYLSSDALAALIKRRPDDLDTIIDIITERGMKVESSDEVKSLEELLDAGVTQPLRNGAL